MSESQELGLQPNKRLPMQFIERISEDEVVASFLAGELDSERFGDSLRALLRRRQSSTSLLTDPDLTDPVECEERRELLALIGDSAETSICLRASLTMSSGAVGA